MAKHIARHQVDINIEKTLIVFSHVEQPTKSKFKIILGRRNEEVSAYRREDSASLELNPLFWWQANSYKYPLLSTVSISILGIPATSVVYHVRDRVFSTAGDIDTAHRSFLKRFQVDVLIFLKKIHEQFFDLCSSILVFTFTKTFSYCPLGLVA